MPTYDYRCESCGHQFEYIQSMTAAPLRNCPKCGGPVFRLIGAGAGLIFKGPGFYITDYKQKPSNKNSRSRESREGGPDKEKETTKSREENSSTREDKEIDNG